MFSYFYGKGSTVSAKYSTPYIWQDHLGEGKLEVTLTIFDTGKGIHGILTGGEEPHLGGVVLALPRPSLAQSDLWSADLYITPVPGHKDVEVANTLAAILSKDLKQPIVISAGIHSDDLARDEINIIINYCEQLRVRFLEWIARNRN